MIEVIRYLQMSQMATVCILMLIGFKEAAFVLRVILYHVRRANPIR